MGLKFNGRNVAAMSFNGRDAIEARCNGSVVWPTGQPAGGPLRFVAEEAGSTLSPQIVGSLATVPVLEYSFDGEVWTEFSCDNAPVITLAGVGDTVWLRGNNAGFGDGGNYTRLMIMGKVSAFGSIEYLRNKNGAIDDMPSYCYSGLFEFSSGLVRAPELPAVKLADSCYRGMFSACSNLTSAPELPATTLAKSCYRGMFGACTSLASAPELPATTLANYCYCDMFDGCGCTSAPALPATVLALHCYEGMFSRCRRLASAPALPAPALANGCYFEMFAYCTSLPSAPELPATTLVSECYTGMFIGCTGIRYISVAFKAWYGQATFNWFYQASAAGTFVCPASLPQERGTSRIPNGWTIETF